MDVDLSLGDLGASEPRCMLHERMGKDAGTLHHDFDRTSSTTYEGRRFIDRKDTFDGLGLFSCEKQSRMP